MVANRLQREVVPAGLQAKYELVPPATSGLIRAHVVARTYCINLISNIFDSLCGESALTESCSLVLGKLIRQGHAELVAAEALRRCTVTSVSLGSVRAAVLRLDSHAMEKVVEASVKEVALCKVELFPLIV